MEFVEKVIQFLMGDSTEKHMIFATSAAVVGLVIVILDCLYFVIKKKSLLLLNYKGVGRSVFVIVFWSFAAGLVGLIGGVISILQENLQACFAVGIGWPVIFPRIIASGESREETQVATKEE
jgi:hypothetical protein